MLITTPLDAILLPQQLAICKCDAHTNNSYPVYIDNTRADVAAKLAASEGSSFVLALTFTYPVFNDAQTGPNSVCLVITFHCSLKSYMRKTMSLKVE